MSQVSQMSQTMTGIRIQELAKKCLEVVSGKQAELESTRLRLEGAAEGIQFLMNSLVEVLDSQGKEKEKEEVEGGKSDKPFLATTKA